MSAPTTSLDIGIAVARQLLKLTQPWHPRRYSSADLHRTSGTSRTGPGPGLRRSAVGYVVGVSFDQEPDPYDLAFWGGNPADILSEPAGGHNHGRKRTGDGKPPKAHKARPRSGWDILGTDPLSLPWKKTWFVDGTLADNGMHIETLPTGNPVGRPARPDVSSRTAESLTQEIEKALEQRHGVFWARLLTKAVTGGSVESRYPSWHYMRVLLVTAVTSSDRPAAVLAQVLAPVGKRTIERWRKTEAMSQEPPRGGRRNNNSPLDAPSPLARPTYTQIPEPHEVRT